MSYGHGEDGSGKLLLLHLENKNAYHYSINRTDCHSRSFKDYTKWHSCAISSQLKLNKG